MPGLEVTPERKPENISSQLGGALEGVLDLSWANASKVRGKLLRITLSFLGSER